MSRIRTIKPQFFTSADVCDLSPLARLLYVATWCEADREGRLVWSPRTLKLRYLPADNCNVEALGDELIAKGLVRIYEVDGVIYGWIPTFTDHQVINNRETSSKIDAWTTENDASGTRQARVSDASVGEGKGREGKGKERSPLSPPMTGGEPALFPVPDDAASQDASGPLEQLGKLEAAQNVRTAAKVGRAKAKARTPSPDAVRVLARMAELAGCRYESSATLEARLKSGVPVADCLLVVEHLAQDPWWLEKRFANADAPFRADKFPAYLAQAKSKPIRRHVSGIPPEPSPEPRPPPKPGDRLLMQCRGCVSVHPATWDGETWAMGEHAGCDAPEARTA